MMMSQTDGIIKDVTNFCYIIMVTTPSIPDVSITIAVAEDNWRCPLKDRLQNWKYV